MDGTTTFPIRWVRLGPLRPARDYRWLLAEPGQQHRRGSEHSPGLLLETFGGRPAAAITTKNVADISGGSTGPARRRGPSTSTGR